MRYKDVVREQIMQADTAEDAISSDEDSDNDGHATSRRGGTSGGGGLAYDEEQERLRKSLLGSIAEHDGGDSDGDGDGDDGDGLLKVSYYVFVGGFCGLTLDRIVVISVVKHPCWVVADCRSRSVACRSAWAQL